MKNVIQIPIATEFYPKTNIPKAPPQVSPEEYFIECYKFLVLSNGLKWIHPSATPWKWEDYTYAITWHGEVNMLVIFLGAKILAFKSEKEEFLVSSFEELLDLWNWLLTTSG